MVVVGSFFFLRCLARENIRNQAAGVLPPRILLKKLDLASYLIRFLHRNLPPHLFPLRATLTCLAVKNMLCDKVAHSQNLLCTSNGTPNNLLCVLGFSSTAVF